MFLLSDSKCGKKESTGQLYSILLWSTICWSNTLSWSIKRKLDQCISNFYFTQPLNSVFVFIIIFSILPLFKCSFLLFQSSHLHIRICPAGQLVIMTHRRKEPVTFLKTVEPVEKHAAWSFFLFWEEEIMLFNVCYIVCAQCRATDMIVVKKMVKKKNSR